MLYNLVVTMKLSVSNSVFNLTDGLSHCSHRTVDAP